MTTRIASSNKPGLRLVLGLLLLAVLAASCAGDDAEESSSEQIADVPAPRDDGDSTESSSTTSITSTTAPPSTEPDPASKESAPEPQPADSNPTRCPGVVNMYKQGDFNVVVGDSAVISCSEALQVGEQYALVFHRYSEGVLPSGWSCSENSDGYWFYVKYMHTCVNAAKVLHLEDELYSGSDPGYGHFHWSGWNRVQGNPSPGEYDYNELSVGFNSPSGNISCSISGTSVACRISDYSYEVPQKECEYTPYMEDHAWIVDGEAEYGVCSSSALVPYTPSTLEYGDSLTFAGKTCSSATDGVTCRDETGAGFKMSRASLVEL